jgi:hypothetical protein
MRLCFFVFFVCFVLCAHGGGHGVGAFSRRADAFSDAFSFAQGLWVARIAAIGAKYASRERISIRAYANESTIARHGLRERLERANVCVVETNSATDSADERLISDVYALARDEPDPSMWTVIVVSRDERLARGLKLARDRGVHTVACGDFLSSASRPQFASARNRDGESGLTPSYLTALSAVAANGTLHKKSKLASTAHETLIWDPRRLFPVSKLELDTHDVVFAADEFFGVPVQCPGQCVATWTRGAIAPWTPDSCTTS